MSAALSILVLLLQLVIYLLLPGRITAAPFDRDRPMLSSIIKFYVHKKRNNVLLCLQES